MCRALADQQVANSFVLWQTLREYLNELYVKGEPDEKEISRL
jgi:hypothetical protein